MNQAVTLLCRAEQLSKVIDAPDGQLTILSKVNLTVAAGEAVAILGASGSGKSTLLGLLAGLDQATSGSIWLDAICLDQCNEDERAAHRSGRVGFVFQSFQLLPTLTALENVSLPLELSGQHRHDARQRALTALNQVGLSARVNHYPRQLSGGEQQRVAIARACAPAPRILFADEPTGNLDAATGSRIIDLLLQLRANLGAALVLVTHDAALAARCDRRLLMTDGQLEPLT
ncbi:ATP-binding cassette domain-containing protein [Rhodoferax sp. 4810]|uniref:ATP-binding cassette domain-containing protein n=1 Tax=Thiospirillum jenense TaxID=1653858 RepID=A0A839HFN3_9GAMM|nr:ATP-binding cassette domain-containing protein [Thiospirillum jenense]MBB1073853.1 ATP-binding cassette domain-containing protein [Rhodoferax jenense]MBB1125192.1 ATP-binding cassette domain-containing protein [Thiospirillum jenense]